MIKACLLVLLFVTLIVATVVFTSGPCQNRVQIGSVVMLGC
jgi:hypothetical protein